MQLTDIASLMSGNMTPIILANAGIIAFISTRNVHLSDRSRGITDEMFYKIHQPESLLRLTDEEKDERLQLLIKQNDIFFWRYIGTSVAFVLAAFSFILFCGVSLFVKADGTNSLGDYRNGAALYGSAAAVLLGASFFLLIVEFISGFVTLKENNKSVDRYRIRKKKK